MPGTPAISRIALRPVLLNGPPLLGAVAAEVGLHPRTLRRRLADEGTTFEALRDEMRFTIAKEFLAMTDLPMGEISAALGFASPGVFSEAFRKWSGATPGQWRRGMQSV